MSENITINFEYRLAHYDNIEEYAFDEHADPSGRGPGTGFDDIESAKLAIAEYGHDGLWIIDMSFDSGAMKEVCFLLDGEEVENPKKKNRWSRDD